MRRHNAGTEVLPAKFTLSMRDWSEFNLEFERYRKSRRRSFVCPDYLEFLIRKFAEDSQLGVAGTPFTEEAVTTPPKTASKGKTMSPVGASCSGERALRRSEDMFQMPPVV